MINNTKLTRQHWIQRITFAVETNAADTHTQRDRRRATQYLLRSLSDGEGNHSLLCCCFNLLLTGVHTGSRYDHQCGWFVAAAVDFTATSVKPRSSIHRLSRLNRRRWLPVTSGILTCVTRKQKSGKLLWPVRNIHYHHPSLFQSFILCLILMVRFYFYAHLARLREKSPQAFN